ncbi:WD40 repeat domain-containing protein [Gilvimarinus algae]|uniref:WD40 repeat domain-containing protein n=1 Tax=Gilvimarinus algae TaxID=3058037 RepID=A0ABT8TBF0_9GAMM|nr:WD40 repeat domain-containing protein [Gilvimarinus sp. SDUM040014]MDO3381437.1 WD40 repeat domain-containing protein [Gilvimarinus sp. SDUM040014]
MIKPPVWLFFSLLLSLPALLSCSPDPGPSAELEVAARSVQSGALAPDGTQAVIGSVYHGGSFWQLAERERLFNWNHSQSDMTLLLATAISPDGGWAATVDEQSLVLWNTREGQAAGFWRIPAEVLSVALGRYGNVALLGLGDGRGALYDVRGGGIFRSFAHEGRVNDVAVSDDLSVTLTGGEDFRVKVWDTQTGELRFERLYNEPVQEVALSGDGRRALAAAKYDRVEIFTTDTNQSLWQLPFANERVKRGLNITAARFSDDATYLLTGRPDGLVQLWDIDGQSEVYRWQLPKRKQWQPSATAVIDISFTDDPNRYRAISSNGFVYTLTY